MAEVVRSTSAQVLIWVTVLAILASIGIYVAMQFRGLGNRDRESSNDLLTGFRELRDQGNLSPAEFQKIKTLLGEKLQDELGSKDAEGKG